MHLGFSCDVRPTSYAPGCFAVHVDLGEAEKTQSHIPPFDHCPFGAAGMTTKGELPAMTTDTIVFA